MKKKPSIQQVVLTALFAAVIAAFSQISIPLPNGIPITLQTFAIPLCGFILGWKSGFMSTVIYLLIGFMGAPVFANFSGGPAVFLGKTGGFLIGFIFLALFCGLSMKIKNKPLRFLIAFIGLFADHLLGVLQFAFLMEISPFHAAVMVSFPYLIKDLASVIAAYGAAAGIRRSLSAANINIGAKQAPEK